MFFTEEQDREIERSRNMAKKPNATAFIEDVLLPHLNDKCCEYAQCSDLQDLCVSSTYAEIANLIQSRRSEWAQEVTK